MQHTQSDYTNHTISRRNILRGFGLVTAGAAAGLGPSGFNLAAGETGRPPANSLKGRINHSIVSWPYQVFGEQWDLDTICQVARDLGCKSVELVDPDGWPTLAKYGLECAIAPNGMPGEPYIKGLNNPANHDEVIGRTRKVIEAAARAPVKVLSVIAFTGFKYWQADDPSSGEIPPDVGAGNVVDGLKKLALLAEQHGVSIYLEHLNSRITGDTNRGHPGYQGDDIDYCADIIRRVGSPRVKLLFDIYHVQIMNGDIIRRIREFGPDLIGHIHTAGVPGRAEPDDSQEISYRPVMQALAETGYTGYVGHEFIPTRDPRKGLRETVEICDV